MAPRPGGTETAGKRSPAPSEGCLNGGRGNVRRRATLSRGPPVVGINVSKEGEIQAINLDSQNSTTYLQQLGGFLMSDDNTGQLNSTSGEHPQSPTRQPNIMREWEFHMEKVMADKIGDTILHAEEGDRVIILPAFGTPDQPHVVNLVQIKVVEKGQGGQVVVRETPEGSSWSRSG